MTTSVAPLASTYDLHYVEYGSTVAVYPADSTGVWVDGKQIATGGANQIFGKRYDKDYYYNLEQPPVYYISNPTASSADQRKRYFPPALAEVEINIQNNRISAYEALLSTYNTKVEEYNRAIGVLKAREKDWFNAIFRP